MIKFVQNHATITCARMLEEKVTSCSCRDLFIEDGINPFHFILERALLTRSRNVAEIAYIANTCAVSNGVELSEPLEIVGVVTEFRE